MTVRVGTEELVDFRFFSMPCCGHQLCWVNPRLPIYCPECGELVHGRLQAAILLHAPAVLKIHKEETSPVNEREK